MTTLPDDVAAALDSATRNMAPEAAEACRVYVDAMHRMHGDRPSTDVQRLAGQLLAGTVTAMNGAPQDIDRVIATAIAASNAINGQAAGLLLGAILGAYVAGRDAGYMAGLLASTLDGDA